LKKENNSNKRRWTNERNVDVRGKKDERSDIENIRKYGKKEEYQKDERRNNNSHNKERKRELRTAEES